MNLIDRTVDDLHELVTQVPEIVQPVIERATVTKPESTGRQRSIRGLVRDGVPRCPRLGPLAIPTPSTAAIPAVGT